MPLQTAIAFLLSCVTLAGASPIRVACIGDSITHGNANADWTVNAWPHVLGRMLERTSPGQYDVANFGRSGATLLKQGTLPWWDQIQYTQAMAFNPDIAIINLGTNDAGRRNAAHRGTFAQDLESLLNELQALPASPTIYLSTLTPMFEPYRDIAYCKAPRAELLDIIRAEATKRGLAVIDFDTPLAGRTDLIPDGIHPNTPGNALMAAAAFEAIMGTAAPRDRTIEPVGVRSMPRQLVSHGMDAAVLGAKWTPIDGAIRGAGKGNRLVGGLHPGKGSFHMRARLRMDNLTNSAAAFHLGPDVFGFEGAAGRLFRNGPHMGGLRLLHPAGVLFKRGDWIDFDVIRNGTQVFFLIDGQVVDTAIIPGVIDTMAFDPMRSTMELSDWSIAGDVEVVRPPHVEARTIHTPWTDFAMSQATTTQSGSLDHRDTLTPAAKEAAAALPVLSGRAHAMTMLPSGGVLIAFQDTLESSPTAGAGVLWRGTLDDLKHKAQGKWTTILAPASALGTVTDTTIEPAGAGFQVAFEHDGLITTSSFTLDELEALVPSRGWSVPLVDLDAVQGVHVVVDRKEGQYLGHSTTVLLEDGQTILCVYPKGHGRGGICYKRSSDGGATWSDRLVVPDNWSTSREVPTIHRVIDPKDGTKRLIMWSGLYPARLAVSDDDGAQWSNLEPVGDWGGIVVMGFVEQLNDGRYMAMFHDDGRFFQANGPQASPVLFTVYKTFSDDGGLTWSDPEVVWSGDDVHLCEPGCVRSPNGSRLAVLLRENSRQRNSYVIFSDDEGATWSPPRELPAALTGDRHTGKYLDDGRLFISFRDTAIESPTQGDWCGWVGTWDDIEQGRPGQYRVRLKDNTHSWDTAYPGVEVLPDGTIVTVTYGHWDTGQSPYIRAVRVHPRDLDALATPRGLGE
jgi:lysophospholipase L1-like esterase